MTREEIKKAMRDTKKEVVLKNLHKLLSLVEGYSEYEDCVGYAIETLEREPTTKNDLGVIDRKKLIDWINIWNITPIIKNPLIRHIQGMPSVTPIRPKGHWIDHSDDGYVECPRCGSATSCDDNIDDLHFCYSCGAEMEVEE